MDFSPAIGQLQEMLNGTIVSLPKFIMALVVFVLFILVDRGAGALVRKVSTRHQRHTNAEWRGLQELHRGRRGENLAPVDYAEDSEHMQSLTVAVESLGK